jgi:hypothetical protein
MELSSAGLTYRNGSLCGELRWEDVLSWSKETVTELPEHYLIQLDHKDGSKWEIVLFEPDYPLSKIETLLTERTGTEPGEGGNSE